MSKAQIGDMITILMGGKQPVCGIVVGFTAPPWEGKDGVKRYQVLWFDDDQFSWEQSTVAAAYRKNFLRWQETNGNVGEEWDWESYRNQW